MLCAEQSLPDIGIKDILIDGHACFFSLVVLTNSVKIYILYTGLYTL